MPGRLPRFCPCCRAFCGEATLLLAVLLCTAPARAAAPTLTVWQPSSGDWLINQGGPSNAPITQTWGFAGAVPVPGDYDGDGIGVPTLAVAYVLMEGGDGAPDTKPFLRFYDKLSGGWQLKATASALADFEYHTFSVAQLNSGVQAKLGSWPGDFRSEIATERNMFVCTPSMAPRSIPSGNAMSWIMEKSLPHRIPSR